MAKKIVLDAGHALGLASNKSPDGIDEWTLNHKVALTVAKQLADYEVEIHRVDDTTGKKEIDLYERVSRTNKIAPDVFVSIHHNTCTGKWGAHGGVEVYYNSNRKNEIEKALAREISEGIAANTGLKNLGAKTAANRILTVDTKIIALLTEGGFMDSVFDHDVITSTKGQESYAKAISDALIKQLKLTKKVEAVEKVLQNNKEINKDNTTGTISPSIKVGSKYTLKNNTSGYYTSADAKARRDQRVSVLAGEHYVYSIYNDMINITKSKGYAGSWINPAQVMTSTTTTTLPTEKQTLVVGGKYTLESHTPGYYTSADAKAGKNQRVTVLADVYIIYNIANDMINITKIKGKPGSWINPNKVK